MTDVKVPLAALAAVSPMMGVNDIRYYLNGILINIDGNDVTCVATDGRTLAVARHRFESQEKTSFMIKREDVISILRNINKEDGLHFKFGEGVNMEISFGQHVMAATRMEGEYPDWQLAIATPKAEGRQRTMVNPIYLERIAKSWKLLKKYGHFDNVGCVLDTNGASVSLHGLLSDEDITVGYAIMPMRFDDSFPDSLIASFLPTEK